MKAICFAIILTLNFFANTSFSAFEEKIVNKKSLDKLKIKIFPTRPGIFESELEIYDDMGNPITILPPWTNFTFRMENHTKMNLMLIEVTTVIAPKMAPLIKTYRNSVSLSGSYLDAGGSYEISEPIYLAQIPYEEPPSNYSDLEMVTEFVIQDIDSGEYFRLMSSPYYLIKP